MSKDTQQKKLDESLLKASQHWGRTTNDEGNTLTISQLLEQGANPNYIDIEGNTCLFYAAHNTNQKTIRLLLDYGANPLQINAAGETAFVYASKRINRKTADKEIIALLGQKTEAAEITESRDESNYEYSDISDSEVSNFSFELDSEIEYVSDSDSEHSSGSRSSTPKSEPENISDNVSAISETNSNQECVASDNNSDINSNSALSCESSSFEECDDGVEFNDIESQESDDDFFNEGKHPSSAPSIPQTDISGSSLVSSLASLFGCNFISRATTPPTSTSHQNSGGGGSR